MASLQPGAEYAHCAAGDGCYDTGGVSAFRLPGAELPMTAKPYDPTLKALVETEPESWPVLLGQPKAPTEVIDADIATVSGAADKVLSVAADLPYLLHLEFV